MSFIFSNDMFDDMEFNEKIKRKLNLSLNKSFKDDNKNNNNNIQDNNLTDVSSEEFDFLSSGITVTDIKFNQVPSFKILDLDITTKPRSLIKGICKISIRDALIELSTIIESNLLYLNVAKNENLPDFIKPTLIENNSFKIPIKLVFQDIKLDSICNFFIQDHGVSISFNDISIDFQFNCSIKILQKMIEKNLKNSIQSVFKDILPSVIFNMSQNWFNKNHDQKLNHLKNTSKNAARKIILDDSDLNPLNLLKLSTIVISRNSLSLTDKGSIKNCLERSNLYRFISQLPSLSNDTSSMERTNMLPSKCLDNVNLTEIINIQNKLYERSETTKPKRRRVRLNRKKKTTESKHSETTKPIITMTQEHPMKIVPTRRISFVGINKDDNKTHYNNNNIQNFYNNWKWNSNYHFQLPPPPPYTTII
ncbi:hypothetical protein KAFR_0F04220 [Kazachstania africana CBS 2517]|uniref:SMP-LTD domain-containing protein n=1 Tax=Kazachstania africana (strain ATCC 22294 / BCRC 22015 / CBS 2517 / CECT 1963 / NBRC 1671 / NRRL Y-8276) TaxID=1071382 RepID=H2AXB7_KAZAF|nr:hypothetical protein KAFR_0F04220 [Kazachstania africana CBS 2517]CCF59017.1 hypothetical protein KAFR_0F04220 [Kazachstania africana CBS 2517]